MCLRLIETTLRMAGLRLSEAGLGRTRGVDDPEIRASGIQTHQERLR